MSLVDFAVSADLKSMAMIFRARVMVDGQLKHVAKRVTTLQAAGITRVRAAVLAEQLPKFDMPPPAEEVQ